MLVYVCVCVYPQALSHTLERCGQGARELEQLKEEACKQKQLKDSSMAGEYVNKALSISVTLLTLILISSCRALSRPLLSEPCVSLNRYGVSGDGSSVNWKCVGSVFCFYTLSG